MPNSHWSPIQCVNKDGSHDSYKHKRQANHVDNVIEDNRIYRAALSFFFGITVCYVYLCEHFFIMKYVVRIRGPQKGDCYSVIYIVYFSRYFSGKRKKPISF